MNLRYKLIVLLFLTLSSLFSLISCNRPTYENTSDVIQMNDDELSNISVYEEENKNNKIFSKFKATDIYNKTYDDELLKQSKINLINIWATFSQPSINGLSYMSNISKNYKSSDVQVIGIVIDTIGQDSSYSTQIINAAQDLLKQSNINYVNLLPSKDLINLYLSNVKIVPQTLMVDSKGNLLKTIIGQQDEQNFGKIIDEELINYR